jgi:hypothetical protein
MTAGIPSTAQILVNGVVSRFDRHQLKSRPLAALFGYVGIIAAARMLLPVMYADTPDQRRLCRSGGSA